MALTTLPFVLGVLSYQASCYAYPDKHAKVGIIGDQLIPADWTQCMEQCSNLTQSVEHSAVPVSPLPNRLLRDAPDTILTFLKKTYRADRKRVATNDSGSPLFLTPYIEENKLKEAREAAYVDPEYLLPGMESYAGYLTVNKEYDANLWFWYFPVSGRKVEDTPWILWLQGGPGASSLFGLFTEIGPFFVSKDNHLEEMKHSWGKNHSLLFIDNPVGTGFSFTKDDRGYPTNQTTIGENLYNALQQFLTIFPELRQAPLTVAGESYAGKHIPSLGVQIHWHKDEDEPINLQGLAIGNGFIDPLSLMRYSYFVREVGLVSDAAADEIRATEAVVVKQINEGQMLQAFYTYNSLLDQIMIEANQFNMYNYLQSNVDLDGPHIDFIQSHPVRKALHVGNTEYDSINNLVYEKLQSDMMHSTKAWLEELLENYKVLLYNGHLDIIVAYHPSVNTYNSLSFSGALEFKQGQRKPWYHDWDLAGYYRVAANLTEVMVRGSGHMVPSDKPAAALGLISAFARGLSLEQDTVGLVDQDQSIRRRKLPPF